MDAEVSGPVLADVAARRIEDKLVDEIEHNGLDIEQLGELADDR